MSRKHKDDGQGGLTRYDFGTWGPLMTANQLEIMGYRAAKKHLPPPAGYYWREASRKPRHDAGPVFLYDPAHATRRKPTGKVRLTKGVNQIQWPVTLLWVLGRYVVAQEEKAAQEHYKQSYSFAIQDEISAARRDIVHVAACLVFGMYDESLTGPYLTVTFPPILFRRRYADEGAMTWTIAEWIGQSYERVMKCSS